MSTLESKYTIERPSSLNSCIARYIERALGVCRNARKTYSLHVGK